MDLDVKLMGETTVYGSQPIPGTGYSVPDIGNIYLLWDD